MELTEFIVVAVFSAVQSVFGMGLLVFGTPTMVLLGNDLADSILMLLPSSILISLGQIYLTGREKTALGADRIQMWFCLIGLVGGCLVLVGLSKSIDAHVPLGILLLSTSLIRAMPWLQRHAATLLETQARSYHLVMGFIHGATNLGGALLAVKANTYCSGKMETLGFVSRYYAVFAGVQLSIISALHAVPDLQDTVICLMLSLCAFLVFASIVSRSIEDHIFSRMFSVFVVIYGCLLLFST